MKALAMPGKPVEGRDEPAPPPRPRGRPRDPARLDRVLAAARVHFSESGFDGGSMERIAATAAVSKVTLYNYFPSKEALFNAVVNEPIQRAFEVDVEGLDPARPAESLRRIAENYLALITSRDLIEHLRLLHAGAAANPLLGRSFVQTGPEAVTRQLAKYLKAAHACGSLVIPSAAQAAEQFVAMVRGNEQMRMLLGQAPLRGAAARKRYCRSCVDLFVRSFSR